MAAATSNPLAEKPRYIFYFRRGSNPHPEFFCFDHDSRDMRVIVERAKKHCEIMGYRFVNVRPFLVDLIAAEIKAMGAEGIEYATQAGREF